MKISLSPEHMAHLRHLGHPKPPKHIHVSANEYKRVKDAWVATLGEAALPTEVHKRAIGQLAWSKHAADKQQLEQVDMRGVVFWLRVIAALLLTIAYGVGEIAMHRQLPPAPKPTPAYLQGVVFQTNEEVPNGIEEEVKQEVGEESGQEEGQILTSVMRLLANSNTQAVLVTALAIIIFAFYARFHRF